jgi:hypothetical protein
MFLYHLTFDHNMRHLTMQDKTSYETWSHICRNWQDWSYKVHKVVWISLSLFITLFNWVWRVGEAGNLSDCIREHHLILLPQQIQHYKLGISVVTDIIRAALHLEVGPIHCVRGLKSSLVIGQKAQVGPNPFTPRGGADLVVWFYKTKNVCYDTAWAHWVGCTQNGGPILGLEANVIFH